MSLDIPNIIWITGLSGAGKSTLAKLVVKKLRAKSFPTIMLDGDDLRKVLSSYRFDNLENHEKNKRVELALTYSKLCRYLSSNGFNIVIATISLYKKVHEWNRQNLKNYHEVYLDIPIEELRKRDNKDIYKKYDEGKIKNVAGLDLEIDEPVNPRWHFKYKNNLDLNKLADIIFQDLIV